MPNMMNFKDHRLDARKDEWSDILEAIQAESISQIEQHGIQDKPLPEWLMWTTEEYGEFGKEICDYFYGRGDPAKVVHEGIQTMTLLAKMIESVMVHERAKRRPDNH